MGTLRSLRILHRAMLLGLILFAVTAFFVFRNDSITASLRELDQTLQIVVLLLSAAGFYIGYWVFRKRVGAARDGAGTISEKAMAYRSAAILQWGLLEGPALFSIICFMLTGNLAFLALTATLALILFLTGPSKLKIMMLLRLSEAEMEAF